MAGRKCRKLDTDASTGASAGARTKGQRVGEQRDEPVRAEHGGVHALSAEVRAQPRQLHRPHDTPLQLRAEEVTLNTAAKLQRHL